MEIKETNISECTPFQGNPFKVKDDLNMDLLIQSIRDNGVLVPIVVCPLDSGGYEIISGHRRVHACQKAGIDKIPAFILEMNRDESVIFLVDSNLQREGLLPSEKAFAFKMKVDALNHQGKTSVQLGQKSSRSIVAVTTGESETQIQRFIRLTFLKKPLLDLVDEGRIALTPAVELSYLSPEEQQMVIETFMSDEVTPSHSQAIRMRKLSEDCCLDMDSVFSIMTEVKGNQKEYLKLPLEKYGHYLNRFTTPKEKEDFIEKALAYYQKYLNRQRDAR